MGFLKDIKADTIAKEARRAVDEGRTVFAAKLNMPATSAGFSGAVSGWAEMIETVEACGWRLTEWTVSVDSKGKTDAYPLFRRA